MDNENPKQDTPAVEAAAKEPAKPLPSPFYGDGYMRRLIIPSELTRFAPVKIAFRPITADEDSQASAWMRLNPDKPIIDFFAPLLEKKINSWDIVNHQGAKVEPTAANIRLLSPDFYPVLINVVNGSTPLPDIDGNPGPDAKN